MDITRKAKGKTWLTVLAAALVTAPAAAWAQAAPFHPELARVSAPSPFAADCNGPKFPITAAYVDAESEPYVAVDPRRPENLIAVYHEDRYPNDGANGVLAATSADGGASWSVPALGAQPKFSRCAGGDAANGGDFEKSSDPWVAFGADGTAYFAAVAWNASDAGVAQLVARSTDAGQSWEAPVTVIRSHDPDVSDASRPVVTTDPAHPQTAYLVWARQRSAPADAVRGSVMFSRTTDAGRTWSAPRAIYETAVGMQTSANQIVVLADGVLLNVFNELRAGAGDKHPRRDRIALLRSQDGGRTWSAPSTLATSEVAAVADPRAGTVVRTGDSFTGIAVDPRAGRKTLYAAWSDARFTRGKTQQLALARSTDGGLTWTAPRAVVPASGDQQFIPGVAVNGQGDVAVTWYAFAAVPSGAGLPTRYWTSVSRDQAQTWSRPVSITREPFDFRTIPFNAGFFVGEYQGLAARAKDFVVAVTLPNGHDLANRTDIYACVLAPDGAQAGARACGQGDAARR